MKLIKLTKNLKNYSIKFTENYVKHFKLSIRLLIVVDSTSSGSKRHLILRNYCGKNYNNSWMAAVVKRGWNMRQNLFSSLMVLKIDYNKNMLH